MSPDGFIHESVIDEATRSVLRKLADLPDVGGFYLAGGTAAALQLGHRQSLDLDLFSERPWSPDRMAHVLGSVGDLQVDRAEPGTLIGTLDRVRLSLFKYDALLLDELVITDLRVPLAALRDIACMKLVAIAQRGSKKDFIDIYHLAAAGIGVRETLRMLPAKYPGVRYSPVHLARSLGYFDDAEAEPDPVMLVPYSWTRIREFALAESSSLIEQMADA
jgi:hypothetical protein